MAINQVICTCIINLMHLNAGIQDGHAVQKLAIFQVFWMSGFH